MGRPSFEEDKRNAQNRAWALVPERARGPLAYVVLVILAIAALMGAFGGVSLLISSWPEGEGVVVGDENTAKPESAESSESRSEPLLVEVCRELDDDWGEQARIYPGELVRCRIIFTNDSGHQVENVLLACVLTDNLEVVEGSAIRSGGDGLDSMPLPGLSENADVVIGGLQRGEKVEVEFYLRPVSADVEGIEVVTAKVSVSGNVFQQSARIEVTDPNGGWGDNTNDRQEYTEAEVGGGALGSVVTFNSVSDGEIGHEFNFVGAWGVGESGYWHANSLEAEDGKTCPYRAAGGSRFRLFLQIRICIVWTTCHIKSHVIMST